MLFSRVIVIVLDGVGIGGLPDADIYGDVGSNTLVNTANCVGGLYLPNLEKLGLGNIDKIKGVSSNINAIGGWGKMLEKSKGKDTTTGHWEIMGLILDKAFPTYPNGFPDEIIKQFVKETGRDILGNYPASGTEIIKALGEEHQKTGKLIVYTSADSVFQIAAHTDIIPLEELYNYSLIARNILKGEHNVARVIARPFIGTPGNYQRDNANRKDFSVSPPRDTVMNYLVNSGKKVLGIGKIENIFNGSGLTQSIHTKDNLDGINHTISAVKESDASLIFTNLVDFDMKYGHRNDPNGMSKALSEFDQKLGILLNVIKPEDFLIITADHGCDPTTISTDHSREYVPLLTYTPKHPESVNLGIRSTFADVGASILDGFDIKIKNFPGNSFLNLIY